ncbi:hypothetical protein [Nodosilinea nodulosa]|uniref:hypothetical protein n=1 Tax=Nodosilinea nodulosa TaxID=416001 RepID=UPI0002E13503|nr:hypothetical protein [Nodosilinea nodulosa]
MLWLSMVHVSDELEPIAADSRPWATLQKFWRFCNLYGEYQSRPPSLRRQFIVELEATLPSR